MKKLYIFFIIFLINALAHPVNYTIELQVSYDETTKEAKIICQSNSKNKCGLYSINLLDENEKTIADVKFPFLKESTTIKTNIKPSKLDFYLRSTPEHKYRKIF